MLFMSPFVAATTMTTLDKAQVLKTMQSTNLRFTHSVFVEEAMARSCCCHLQHGDWLGMHVWSDLFGCSELCAITPDF